MTRENRIRMANEQLLGNGNLDVVEQVFATEYVVHAGGKDHAGLAFIRKFVELVRTAIPDVRVVDIAILNHKGNMITWQRTLTGTHKKTMAGIPPSQRKVTWRDMLVSRFEGDKIAEEWNVSELAGELLIKQRPGK